MEQEEPPTRKNRPTKWRCKSFMSNHWRGLASILLPFMLLPIALVERTKAMRCAYMIMLMLFYWILNVIPYAVTAMFPIFLLPLFDIEDTGKVASGYFSNITCLLCLSVIVAKGIEESNLHKRVAIAVLNCVGFGPKVLHVYLLSITALISMFIPNIATTAMMFPIIKAVLIELEKNDVLKLTLDSKDEDEEEENPTNEAICFYLGVAYAANIGGVATLDGSGIALTFTQVYLEFFPTEELHWGWHFVLCFPLAVILGVIVIAYLQFTFLGLWRDKNKYRTLAKADIIEIIKVERETLGRLTFHEVGVILGMMLMLLLIFFRDPPGLDGYADKLYSARKMSASSAVAICIVFLFIVPSNFSFFRYCRKKDTNPLPKGETNAVLTWGFIVKRVPWGIIYLVGAGTAMNIGMKQSGLATHISDMLATMKDWPYEAQIIIIIFVSAILAQVFVSIAAVNLILSFLLPLSLKFKVHPLRLCLPSSLVAMGAYLLPASGSSLALVTATAHIKPAKTALYGLFPWTITMVFTYIHAIGWMRVVYYDLGNYPLGLKPNLAEYKFHTNESSLAIPNKP